MRIKQSLCYPLYKKADQSFNEFFAIVADIGAVAVETWFRDDSFDEMVKAAKDNNLAIASMCAHMSLENGLNKRENHDRIEEEIRESIDIAADVGVPGLICFSGNRNEGQDDLDGLEACAEGLGRVAAYAEEKGINLNVELLNSKVDHATYQCDHTAWGVALCEKVNSPRVKLLYDIYHMQIMEGDVIRTIRENIQWFGHFHTAGNPGRNEMDDTQELNYIGICKAIANADYDLYVGHEYQPTSDPIDSLRAMVKLCDQG